jgi:hypothetical protein
VKLQDKQEECGNKETTGSYQHACTFSHYACATTSGRYSYAFTTGGHSNALTTGHFCHAKTFGKCANAVAVGNSSSSCVKEEGSIAASLGHKAKAIAGIGGGIVLAHRGALGKLLGIKASTVGENGIKPAVWYTLDNSGEFVEVPDMNNK